MQDRLETLESGIKRVIEDNRMLESSIKKATDEKHALAENNRTLRTAIAAFTTRDTFQEAQRELKSFINACKT